VRERGVAVGQAAKDLAQRENVLRKWVKDLSSNAGQAYPGRGKMRPDDAEVARLRRELAKTKASQEGPSTRVPGPSLLLHGLPQRAKGSVEVR
jgi:transposase